jgi:hypothetical protein
MQREAISASAKREWVLAMTIPPWWLQLAYPLRNLIHCEQAHDGVLGSERTSSLCQEDCTECSAAKSSVVIGLHHRVV